MWLGFAFDVPQPLHRFLLSLQGVGSLLGNGESYCFRLVQGPPNLRSCSICIVLSYGAGPYAGSTGQNLCLCPKIPNPVSPKLAEDPATDLSKIVPIRLYGDGAEAMRVSIKKSETADA